MPIRQLGKERERARELLLPTKIARWKRRSTGSHGSMQIICGPSLPLIILTLQPPSGQEPSPVRELTMFTVQPFYIPSTDARHQQSQMGATTLIPLFDCNFQLPLLLLLLLLYPLEPPFTIIFNYSQNHTPIFIKSPFLNANNCCKVFMQ